MVVIDSPFVVNLLICPMSDIQDSISRPLNQSIKASIEDDPRPPKQKQPREDIRPQRSSINPIIEQQIYDSDLRILSKSSKKYFRLQICSAICIIIAILFIFAMPPILTSVIKSQAIDKTILSPQNEKLWAHFPGDAKVEVVRNYTFFNFSNADRVFFANQKPKFHQIADYKITQVQDYLDIQYLDNGNLVEVTDWLRFLPREDSRDLKQRPAILNMGAVGYWYQLKNSRPSVILQQGLSMVFTNLEDSVLPNLFGQGINAQYLKDLISTTSTLYSPAGVDPQNSLFLWKDEIYGMGKKDNLVFWVDAAQSCLTEKGFIFSEDALFLKRYFTLTDNQLQFMMEKFNFYVDSLRYLLLQNNYCVDMNISLCTGRYLAARQMSESFVTFSTPPVSSIDPTLSICDTNKTCNGTYPQLSSYYENVYSKVVQPLPNLHFDYKTTLRWMDYNTSTVPGIDYNTAEDCLLHVGNLDAIWDNGTIYDQTKSQSALLNIQNRMGLTNTNQTKVFWAWIKYQYFQFVRQKQSTERLGMAASFVQGIYPAFSYLQDNLQSNLLAKLIRKDITTVGCPWFFSNSMEISLQRATQLCKRYPDYQIKKEQFVLQMLDICSNKFQSNWQKLKSKGVSLSELEQLCDPDADQGQFGQFLHKHRVQLNDKYGCTVTPVNYCSDYELAAIQWSTSAVTLQVLPSLAGELKPSTTFASWNVKSKAFEYFYFKSKYFSESEQKQMKNYNLIQTYELLTFDNWFSSPVVLQILKDPKINSYLKKYIRFIIVYVTLQGFTNHRTVNEYMFGYEDEFLRDHRTTYPPFGGDPSAQSVIAFNDLNITQQEATMRITFWTGKDDYTKTLQNYKINGLQYLATNYSRFNGNHSYTVLETPWAEKDYFYGTTAKIFSPNQWEANNISLYIPNLQRYGSGPFYDGFRQDRYGIELWIEFMGEDILANDTVQPKSKIYYQKFEAVFNETSVVGIPIFTTKNHFMNTSVDDAWLEKVQIWDEKQKIHYQNTSHWDDTFLLVEPYTGVSFQCTIYLQNNYYHERDQLFDFNTNVLLPVFTIYRSGNLTEDKANELYGPLLLGLSLRGVIRIIGIVLIVVSIGLLAFFTYKKKVIGKESNRIRQSAKEDKPQMGSGMGISLQPQNMKNNSKDQEEIEVQF